ncbi:sensor histidine kinase [Alkalibacterium kapii]|nr:PAS domain-containing protein [Alkalibacterium kapii]
MVQEQLYFTANRKNRMALNRRHLLTAIAAGLLGIGRIFFSFQIAIDTVSINFVWSILFPLLISLSYGKVYGLISITFGGLFLYPYIMGPTNGWASLVPMLSLYLLIFLHGYGQESRNKEKQWFNHPVVIQSAYSVLRLLFYAVLFQPLIQLNGSYWPGEALTSIDASVVRVFLIRGLIMEWLLLAVTFVLLHLPFVKKALGLAVKTSQRFNTRVFASMVTFGLVFMLVSIQIQAHLFHDAPITIIDYRFTKELGFLLFFSGILFTLLSGVTIHFLERHLESESRLFKSARRYQTLFESMDDLVFECDEQGTILEVSASVLKTLKYEQVEVLGKSFFSFINKKNEKENWLEDIKTNETVKDEAIEIKTYDGDKRYWSMRLKKVALSDQETRLVSVVRDFTDYQYALNQIQKLNQTLEDKVDERTERLHETLLSLERFVQMVSHDLKTPARAISAYAEVLLEDERDSLNAKSLAYLKQIQGVTDDMIQLIESLLSYAMLGTREADAEWIEPTPIIETVLSRLELAYPETICMVDYLGELDRVYADRILFQQAITNILENAYKYKNLINL